MMDLLEYEEPRKQVINHIKSKRTQKKERRKVSERQVQLASPVVVEDTTVAQIQMTLEEAKTHTPRRAIPPFLITVRVAGKKLHNCMMDSSAGANIMPWEVCKALNLPITESPDGITKLDNTPVKVVGMIHNLRIHIASEPRIERDIDVQVVQIPPKYAMLLSKDYGIKNNV